MAGAKRRTTKALQRAPKPPKRGRPAKPEGHSRIVPIEVKVSKIERDAIDACAAKTQKTRSTWCYEAIIDRLRSENG